MLEHTILAATLNRKRVSNYISFFAPTFSSKSALPHKKGCHITFHDSQCSREAFWAHTFVCLDLVQLCWFQRSGQDQLGGWLWSEQQLVHLVQPTHYLAGGCGQMEKPQSPHHPTTVAAAASSKQLSAWLAPLLALP